ncbi:MAG: hypothetical protein IKW74_03190 [Thermoguttaceae bacterium]|nr:hypothetical protein [Thermoguttaceae bacterium]
MTYRVITRGTNGKLRIRDYAREKELLLRHEKTGVDDCSIDLRLRGQPVFRGLIGPLPDTGGVVRYETPEVFEKITREWSASHKKKKRQEINDGISFTGTATEKSGI